MRAAVESASRLALDANSETFLKLAREVFGRDQAAATATLKEREEAIKQLVEPLEAGAGAAGRTVEGPVDANSRSPRARLTGQIENLVKVQDLLQRETRNLSTALRRPEVRGRWGEITLRRVVELAGMSEHCDFTEQNPGQQRRHGRRCAPTCWCACPMRAASWSTPRLRSMPTWTPRKRRTTKRAASALRRHAQQVEKRVRELGQKSYWEQFEDSPEFAVLFLPGDQFLSAALAERPDLIDSALKQRIIVTTPSTLMALLKVIAYGWRQTKVTENAREIRELGQDLHKRLNVFVNHLQKVGRSLGNAVESFNAAVGSMERNVMPQARKFPELGATTDAGHRTGRSRSKRRCAAWRRRPRSKPTNPPIRPAHLLT